MTHPTDQRKACDCKSYNGGFGTVPTVIVKAPEIHKCDTICLDACIADTIQQLWANEIVTLSSCCGHNELNPSVVVANDEDMAKVQSILQKIDPTRTWEVSQWQRVVYTPPPTSEERGRALKDFIGNKQPEHVEHDTGARYVPMYSLLPETVATIEAALSAPVPVEGEVRDAVEHAQHCVDNEENVETWAVKILIAATNPAVPREVVDALNNAERWLYVRDGSAYTSDADNDSAKRLRETILEAISILDMTCNSYDLSKLKHYISEARRNCWTKEKLESLLDQALAMLTKEGADGR